MSLARHESEAAAAEGDGSGEQWTDKGHAQTNGQGSASQGEQLRARLVQSSEVRLQMDFLEARSIWLARQLDGSSSKALSASSASSGSSGTDSSTVKKAASASSSATSTLLGPYGQVDLLLHPFEGRIDRPAVGYRTAGIAEDGAVFSDYSVQFPIQTDGIHRWNRYPESLLGQVSQMILADFA